VPKIATSESKEYVTRLLSFIIYMCRGYQSYYARFISSRLPAVVLSASADRCSKIQTVFCTLLLAAALSIVVSWVWLEGGAEEGLRNLGTCDSIKSNIP
jgi:hypothetical protein